MNIDVAQPLERRTLAAGERLFAQGESGDCAYMLLSGEIQLYQRYDGSRIDVGTMQAGSIVGEMAVLDASGIRNASAVAVSDCEVAIMPAALFRDRLHSSDSFLRMLIEMFMANIRQSPKLFLRRPRSVRDHVKQMAVFTWNLRRFAGRMQDTELADDLLDVLDRLDTALTDLGNVAELIPDKRHDLITDSELNGVGFSSVIGSEGRRKV